MKLQDGTLVEFDEYLHFNRYRRATLRSALHDGLVFPTDEYVAYCDQHEDDCWRAGHSQNGKWCARGARKCHRQFGGCDWPAVPLQFGPSEPGPCRWKQRALYDMLKDAVLPARCPLVRLAIWDPVGETTLGAILDRASDSECNRFEPEIRRLIERRLESVPSS